LEFTYIYVCSSMMPALAVPYLFVLLSPSIWTCIAVPRVMCAPTSSMISAEPTLGRLQSQRATCATITTTMQPDLVPALSLRGPSALQRQQQPKRCAQS
jgi:hypothetical protein